MQTPPEIRFQGMQGTSAIREIITDHVAELEKRWSRVTACRVMVKVPSGHHKKGGLYEIHIRLALPDGREVNVQRTPSAHERHADLIFALNDAFQHARRQIQDQVRRAQGQTKRHERSSVGVVTSLDPLGKFGFLRSGDGQEIYFNRNSVIHEGYARLTVGSRVTFAEEQGDKGPQATTVTLLGKHRLRV
jgi:cold shock CspA family protein/ribosome-associated translation inhibitor RaiA